MTYLLDTNTCVHILRKHGNARVKARFGRHAPADLALCSVVVGELCLGAERSRNPPQEYARVDAFVLPMTCLSYDEAAARIAARVRHDLESQGRMIGANDLLIAAIGLAHGLTVVTHNTAEFSRVPGLPCTLR
eukprot:Opistho-2@51874